MEVAVAVVEVVAVEEAVMVAVAARHLHELLHRVYVPDADGGHPHHSLLPLERLHLPRRHVVAALVETDAQDVVVVALEEALRVHLGRRALLLLLVVEHHPHRRRVVHDLSGKEASQKNCAELRGRIARQPTSPVEQKKAFGVIVLDEASICPLSGSPVRESSR